MKKWYAIFFLGFLVLACAQPSPNNDKSIGDLLSHFKQAGFTVGEPVEIWPYVLQLNKADTGWGVMINDCPVIVYKYDTRERSVRKFLAKASDQNDIMMFDATPTEGGKVNFESNFRIIKVNGSFLMFCIRDSGYNDHSDIKDAFMKF